jgi:hypothetical protein
VSRWAEDHELGAEPCTPQYVGDRVLVFLAAVAVVALGVIGMLLRR